MPPRIPPGLWKRPPRASFCPLGPSWDPQLPPRSPAPPPGVLIAPAPPNCSRGPQHYPHIQYPKESLWQKIYRVPAQSLSGAPLGCWGRPEGASGAPWSPPAGPRGALKDLLGESRGGFAALPAGVGVSAGGVRATTSGEVPGGCVWVSLWGQRSP